LALWAQATTSKKFIRRQLGIIINDYYSCFLAHRHAYTHSRIEFCGINFACSLSLCHSVGRCEKAERTCTKFHYETHGDYVSLHRSENTLTKKKERKKALRSLIHSQSFGIDVVKLPIKFQLHTNARTLKALLLSNLIIFSTLASVDTGYFLLYRKSCKHNRR
jgi:hypothetical protein